MFSLATRLRSLDDETLRAALAARAVTAPAIRDFFDLAEALLDPVSVQQALTHLDRGTLAVLAAAGELRSGSVGAEQAPTLAQIAEHLHALGFAGAQADTVAAAAATIDSLLLGDTSEPKADTSRLSPYDAVSEVLRGWPAQGLPGLTDLAAHPAPLPTTTPTDADTGFTDRLAAERAFSAVSSVAELVNELAREPARELSRGGLGLPDTKRLAAVMSIELEAVPALVHLAARAELIARSDGYWMETEAGEAWLLEATTQRWATIAASWFAAVPLDVRAILPSSPGLAWGAGLHAFVAWLYPAGGEWMADRVTQFARDAEILGVTAHHATSSVGAALLGGDLAGARGIMTAALPEEVGAVYLQHDLSIVAPGPLAASIDARLRSLADVESRELASSYRITSASVNRALAAGENAESLLDFLRGISLTGIPQPVDYLITESAARYGRVRVGSLATAAAQAVPAPGPVSAQSYVRSDDIGLLGSILVDQTLAPLALERRGDRLLSSFSADAVFWALSDARYPVAAEDSTGEIVHLRRHPLARVAAVVSTDPARTLVEALRAGDGGEVMAADAWLARQLDTAIRGKQTVTVSISMPGGVVVDYLLEPASVGGGRFRARDRRADIERTLPLSSIISITPAP
ncbi:helicase-associated domain-containing protein [Cryobacterium frigoriphilum]|nr:helicase-associated domain-containing protein [Cryobacterium frigoriphilum]